MNNASKNRTLLFIIAFLLLINIAAVFYFFWFRDEQKRSRDKDSMRNGIALALQKEVGFTDSQVTQYKQLKEEHWKIAKPLFDSMQLAKDNLYNLVKADSVSDSLLQARVDQIAARQKAMDLQGFRHFRKVRALCTPEQLPRYDSLMKKIIAKKGRPQGKDEKNK